MALVALGRVRSRSGDPPAWNWLDEALMLATPTAHLQRLGPVRAARAEAAWLDGDLQRSADEASAAFDSALSHHHRWYIGELAFWLWRAEVLEEPPPEAAEPFALQIAGDWAGAAAAWSTLGCPYEEARALADANDEVALRRALATFDHLGARPMAAYVAKRLRDLGAERIPRGPRPKTRSNPVGLTERQVAVLALMIEGLRNSVIADRLFLSPKTVEHHVSAIFAKLEVDSRPAAIRAGIDLGVASLASAQNYLPHLAVQSRQVNPI
jgi:DNA-binding CsgD family transcriptional regulator